MPINAGQLEHKQNNSDRNDILVNNRKAINRKKTHKQTVAQRKRKKTTTDAGRIWISWITVEVNLDNNGEKGSKSYDVARYLLTALCSSMN